jgi:transposase
MSTSLLYHGFGIQGCQHVHTKFHLACYDYPISTGPLEGINNKIKTRPRQAHGFRDHEFFKLKILALHETRCALGG